MGIPPCPRMSLHHLRLRRGRKNWETFPVFLFSSSLSWSPLLPLPPPPFKLIPKKEGKLAVGGGSSFLLRRLKTFLEEGRGGGGKNFRNGRGGEREQGRRDAHKNCKQDTLASATATPSPDQRKKKTLLIHPKFLLSFSFALRALFLWRFVQRVFADSLARWRPLPSQGRNFSSPALLPSPLLFPRRPPLSRRNIFLSLPPFLLRRKSWQSNFVIPTLLFLSPQAASAPRWPSAPRPSASTSSSTTRTCPTARRSPSAWRGSTRCRTCCSSPTASRSTARSTSTTTI